MTQIQPPPRARAALLGLLVPLLGCAARPTPGVTIPVEELHFVVEGRGEDATLHAVDAEDLFGQALASQRSGDCDRARTLYLRIIDEFRGSRFAAPGLYNAALCLQQAGRRAEAVPLYERLLAGFPPSRDTRHAGFQLAQCFVALERWDDVLRAADRLLGQSDLTSDERLEAMARRAEALVGQDAFDEAMRAAEDALRFYRTRSEDEAVASDYFAAVATLALAESHRKAALALVLPSADVARQHAVLDRRAGEVLAAQRAYFDTIGFGHADLSAIAGHRIGGLYEDFWDAIVRAPVPPPADPSSLRDRPAYEQEYRLHLARLVKPLLRHAIRYWELALLMVERSGRATEWTPRIEADLERARQRLAEQPDGPEGFEAVSNTRRRGG